LGYTEPRWESSALVTIDVQCDVLDGAPLEIAGTSEALPRMAALAEAFREAGRPIVHIVRVYRPDGSNVDVCRRELIEGGAAILAPGASGTELAGGLVPSGVALDAEALLEGGIQKVGPGEVVIYKPRWGAFFQTPLEEHLRAAGADTLVFCGANWPNCPRTSIYQASERDFRVVVASDAVSGLYPQGERELAGIGVTLLPAAEITDAISARAPA
jgi:nicotinamidase-related amidase